MPRFLMTALTVLFLIAPAAAMAQTAAPMPVPAVAAAPSAIRIAVLDDQKILSQSKAAKDVENQLKAKRDSVEAELKTLERKLTAQKEKLGADQGKISQEDFKKAYETYQADAQKAMKLANTRRRDLEQAASGALSQLRAAITRIVAEMAQKNGYSIVITRQNVVLAQETMDITDQVLAQLDRTLTSMPVSFGAAAAKKKDTPAAAK